MSTQDNLTTALLELAAPLTKDGQRAALPGTGGLDLWLEVEQVEEGYLRGVLTRGGDMERVHLRVVEGQYNVLAGAFSWAYRSGATKDAKTMAVYDLVHGGRHGPSLPAVLREEAEKAREQLEGFHQAARNAAIMIPATELSLAAANTALAWLENLSAPPEAPSI